MERHFRRRLTQIIFVLQLASASAESNKTEALGSAIWIHRDFAGLKLEELGYE